MGGDCLGIAPVPAQSFGARSCRSSCRLKKFAGESRVHIPLRVLCFECVQNLIHGSVWFHVG